MRRLGCVAAQGDQSRRTAQGVRGKVKGGRRERQGGRRKEEGGRRKETERIHTRFGLPAETDQGAPPRAAPSNGITKADRPGARAFLDLGCSSHREGLPRGLCAPLCSRSCNVASLLLEAHSTNVMRRRPKCLQHRRW